MLAKVMKTLDPMDNSWPKTAPVSASASFRRARSATALKGAGFRVVGDQTGASCPMSAGFCRS